VKITGDVGRLESPFELSGTFQGGEAVLSASSGGSVTHTLSGTGVTGSGTGTYTMSRQPDGTVRIDQTTTGCIHGMPNSCRTTTEQVTLTPKGAG